MPSTTPDLRTVTGRLILVCGRMSPARWPRRTSMGVRAPRRGGTSAGLARSGLGQASSNVAGCGSAGSSAGGPRAERSGDSRSGGSGSLVRACGAFALLPRGRGEQQIALRLGPRWRRRRVFREHGLAAGGRAGILILPRRRRRRRGAALPACGADRLVAAEQETAFGRRRARAATAASRMPSAPAAPAEPRAMFFSSRTAIQRPNMITPVQTPITPATDQRVADTEFLDRNSEADRQQARQNKANASDQHHNHHRTHPPQPRPKLAQTAHATIPSYCVHRQPPIGAQVPQKIVARMEVRSAAVRVIQVPFSGPAVILPPTNYCQFVALHQGITPQFPITW